MGKLRPIVRLRCAVKHYEWGQIGESSHVARLAERNSGEEIDQARPYAEFWMGTHSSGPSYVASDVAADAVSLKDWIGDNPAVLGEKIVDTWGPDLPFLFKVRWINLPKFENSCEYLYESKDKFPDFVANLSVEVKASVEGEAMSGFRKIGYDGDKIGIGIKKKEMKLTVGPALETVWAEKCNNV